MAYSIKMLSITPRLSTIKVYSLREGITRSYTCMENSEVASAMTPMKAEAKPASIIGKRYWRSVCCNCCAKVFMAGFSPMACDSLWASSFGLNLISATLPCKASAATVCCPCAFTKTHCSEGSRSITTAQPNSSAWQMRGRWARSGTSNSTGSSKPMWDATFCNCSSGAASLSKLAMLARSAKTSAAAPCICAMRSMAHSSCCLLIMAVPSLRCGCPY